MFDIYNNRKLWTQFLTLCLVLLCCGSLSLKEQYELIKKKGNVSITYEASRDQKRNGLTKFKYKWKRNFNYKYKYRQHKEGISLVVTVKAAIDPTISHEIFMPKKERGSAWHDRLLKHEYDHVCISLDERPRLLLSHLVSQFTLEIELKTKDEISNTFINAQINQRIEEYENAVEKMIQANYRLLDHDETSSHGKKKIKNREAFFEKLYQYGNLKKNKFKYLNEVESLLKSEKYQKAETFYLIVKKKQKEIDNKREQKSPGVTGA